MNNASKSLNLVLLLVLALVRFDFSWAAGGVEVTATVDRDRVGVGDPVSLTISVEAKDSVNVEEPNLNNIPGFDLINSSSGFVTRSSYVNGQFITQQSRNFNYMLVANKKGSLTIPPVQVHVDGKTYATKAINVAVSEGRRVPPQARNRGQAVPTEPDDMEDLFQSMIQRHFGQGFPGGGMPGEVVKPEDAFFIQADVDKKKVYVGEPVIANFYLVTRGQIRDIDTLAYPALKGFWKEDLEMATRLSFENVVINGVAYQRALLVSYALFPIKAGKSVVDPYKAKCTVGSPSSFGFGRSFVITKSSKPIDIDVMEVPSNKPANFTGAVGEFRLSAQFEPLTGSVNQPVTLRVRVEGHGNAKLIELPKLDLPPGFEIYDQKSQAKYMKDGSSFKEFEVLIIPRQPGVFRIPPIAIATFDPHSKKFTEIASQPLTLSVTGSAIAPAPGPAQASTGEKGTPSPATPVSSEPALPALATEMGSPRMSPLLAGAISLLFWLGSLSFLGIYAWRKLRSKPKKVSLKLILQRRLNKVREMVDKKEWRRVGVEMTNTAYAILGQLSEEGGANQEIQRLLEKTPPSLRNELSEPIQSLLSQCEALSFAPEGLIGAMSEDKKMEQLIRNFEKVMSRAIELAEI